MAPGDKGGNSGHLNPGETTVYKDVPSGPTLQGPAAYTEAAYTHPPILIRTYPALQLPRLHNPFACLPLPSFHNLFACPSRGRVQKITSIPSCYR